MKREKMTINITIMKRIKKRKKQASGKKKHLKKSSIFIRKVKTTISTKYLI